MSTTDQIAAIGTLFTGIAVLIAVLTFVNALRQYRRDQLQQRAAQTREDLQAIIGDCNLFLHPLNQTYPYPILHTATAITKEFCSRMGASPRREDVLALFSNKKLLLSICVEGWISSEEILHMMDIVEKVELKASSRNLQGKLVLIREASFLLAGLVAEVCSPESFYKILCLLEPHSPRDAQRAGESRQNRPVGQREKEWSQSVPTPSACFTGRYCKVRDGEAQQA